MRFTLSDRCIAVLVLVAVSGMSSAASQLVVFGKPVSMPVLWMMFAFISAYYFGRRAFSVRRDVVNWWFLSWPFSISIMVISIVLVNHYFGTSSIPNREGIALLLAILSAMILANLLVSRKDTTVLTMVCLVVSIPVVLSAIVSVTRPYGILDQEQHTAFSMYIKKREPVSQAAPREISQQRKHFPPEFVAMKSANRRFFEMTKNKNFPYHHLEKNRKKYGSVVVETKKTVKRPVISQKRPVYSGVVASETRWVLQVASFSVRQNAHRLRDKLKKQGYRAYIVSKAGSKAKYRVHIGPVSKKKDANSLYRKLATELNLKGILIKYKSRASVSSSDRLSVSLAR